MATWCNNLRRIWKRRTRRIAAYVEFRYRLFVGTMILLLALLNPLVCIIHCALAQLPHQHMHDHHMHMSGQMMRDGDAANGVHFFCDGHIASLATPESSGPLAPVPQALYELADLPNRLSFLPTLLVTAGVVLLTLLSPQWSTKPNIPPPRFL